MARSPTSCSCSLSFCSSWMQMISNDCYSFFALLTSQHYPSYVHQRPTWALWPTKHPPPCYEQPPQAAMFINIKQIHQPSMNHISRHQPVWVYPGWKSAGVMPPPKPLAASQPGNAGKPAWIMADPRGWGGLNRLSPRGNHHFWWTQIIGFCHTKI